MNQQSPKKQNILRAASFFLNAKEAFAKNDFGKCIQLCRLAIESGGDEAEYYCLLGLSLSQKPEWHREAEKNFRVAIKLAPSNPKYLVALGELYQWMGHAVRARRMFDQASQM